MINKVTLIGHLGQDPEVRRLENGTPVGRFSLATSESYKDAAGELQTQTEWHNIVVWRQQAELSERLLKKGSLAYVEGKISYRKYTDKNGIERYATDITALTFRIMGKKEGISNSMPSEEPISQNVGKAQDDSAFEYTPPSDLTPPPPSDDLPF